MKIAYLLEYSDAALLRWNIDAYQNAARRLGHQYDTFSVQTPLENPTLELPEGYDFYIFYRWFRFPELFYNLLEKLYAKKVPVFYDIDDWIFQPNCRYAAPQANKYCQEFIYHSHGVISASRMLLSKVSPLKYAVERPATIDTDFMYDYKLSEERTNNLTKAPIIYWPNGINRSECNDFVLQYIDELKKQLPEFDFYYTANEAVLPSDEKHRCHRLRYMDPRDTELYYQRIKGLAPDVAINPLDESIDFMHCKAIPKYFEFAAIGVPLISSRATQYVATVLDGVNGYLASTPTEFVAKTLLALDLRPAKGTHPAALEARHDILTYRNADIATAKFLDNLSRFDRRGIK